MSAILVLAIRILMVICLYTFLGWALLTIWQDLRVQTAILQTRKIPALSMAVTNLLDEQISSFSIPEIFIGRSSASTYIIHNETVSSAHARLAYHHEQWWVEDLRSTNGSFLNEERISTPTVVINGDELRCGQVNIHIQIEDTSSHP